MVVLEFEGRKFYKKYVIENFFKQKHITKFGWQNVVPKFYKKSFQMILTEFIKIS